MEHTTGKKLLHDGPHKLGLILDILESERPEITEDTSKFYSDLMKKCWDPKPENRSTARKPRNV